MSLKMGQMSHWKVKEDLPISVEKQNTLNARYIENFLSKFKNIVQSKVTSTLSMDYFTTQLILPLYTT